MYQYFVVCKLNVSTRALRSTTIAKYGQIAVMLSLSPSFFKYGSESSRE